MKYFLSLLFILTSLTVTAGPQHSTVTVEAGVVNQDISIDDTPAPEPVLKPLDVPVSDQHTICDAKCQASEPVQLPNQSVITVVTPAPSVNTPATLAPVPTIKKQKHKTAKVKKQVKPTVVDKVAPVKKAKEPAKAAKTKKKVEPVVDCVPTKRKK